MSHSLLLTLYQSRRNFGRCCQCSYCFLSIRVRFVKKRERLHGNCFAFCFAWSSLKNGILCHGYSISRHSLSSLLLISNQACETRTPFVMVVIVVDVRKCFLAMTLSSFSFCYTFLHPPSTLSFFIYCSFFLVPEYKSSTVHVPAVRPQPKRGKHAQPSIPSRLA